MVCHEGYHILGDSGKQLYQAYIRAETFAENNITLRLLGNEPEDMSALDTRYLRIIGAGKGGKTLGVVLPGPCSQNDRARENNKDTVAVSVRCTQKGIDHVAVRIRVPLDSRYLGSGYDYRFCAVLNQIAESRSRICHCVGAVGDDKAVIAVVVLPYCAGYDKPVLGTDVRAVHVKKLYAFRDAELCNLRDFLKQVRY